MRSSFWRLVSSGSSKRINVSENNRPFPSEYCLLSWSQSCWTLSARLRIIRSTSFVQVVAKSFSRPSSQTENRELESSKMIVQSFSKSSDFCQIWFPGAGSPAGNRKGATSMNTNKLPNSDSEGRSEEKSKSMFHSAWNRIENNEVTWRYRLGVGFISA